MLKALWFLLKLGLIVGLCIWIAERPGTVSVEWMEYTFHIHMGFFLLSAFLLILFALFLHGIVRTLLDIPKNYRKHRDKIRKEKGHQALTKGLTAVAAGDTKAARYNASRAIHYLPEDKGLPILLEAQTARLEGREEEAQEHFLELMKNKDTAFLGVRGLLQTALDQGAQEQALALARKAHDLNPKQAWIVKIRYDLEIKARHWQDARKTLKRGERIKAFTPDKAHKDRIAIHLAYADDLEQQGQPKDAFEEIKKAYKIAPDFVPASYAMARSYLDQGQRSRAVHIIERAWKTGPHPDLLALWQLAMPKRGNKDPLSVMKWYERLLAINPESLYGLLAMAEASINSGLWGEARTYLDRAEAIRCPAKLYQLRAALEEKSGSGDMLAMEKYLKLAGSAEPEPVWVCCETGRIYDKWSPIALPHGSFNTIVWDLPQNWRLSDSLLPGDKTENISILEAPKNG